MQRKLPPRGEKNMARGLLFRTFTRFLHAATSKWHTKYTKADFAINNNDPKGTKTQHRIGTTMLPGKEADARERPVPRTKRKKKTTPKGDINGKWVKNNTAEEQMRPQGKLKVLVPKSDIFLGGGRRSQGTFRHINSTELIIFLHGLNSAVYVQNPPESRRQEHAAPCCPSPQDRQHRCQRSRSRNSVALNLVL